MEPVWQIRRAKGKSDTQAAAEAELLASMFVPASRQAEVSGRGSNAVSAPPRRSRKQPCPLAPVAAKAAHGGAARELQQQQQPQQQTEGLVAIPPPALLLAPPATGAGVAPAGSSPNRKSPMTKSPPGKVRMPCS